jgi:hypothetical protein
MALLYGHRPIDVDYTNHRGETRVRRIIPISMRWGCTEHHTEDQWLLECWDVGKHARRTYALKDCDFRNVA